LLRLGRSRSTDEELQYKAALTVGQLASNAVRMLPSRNGASRDIGFGATVLQTAHQSRGVKEKTNTMIRTRLPEGVPGAAYAATGNLSGSRSGGNSGSNDTTAKNNDATATSTVSWSNQSPSR
jgi:hypothetical protein